jgi:hypothetical protein
MAAPLEESVEFFVAQVFENDTLTVEQRREFVQEALLSLANGVKDPMHRWGLSMRIADLGREAAQKRKKRTGEVGSP